jgi:acyl-CoA synthetase (AMP-forming)/AMP-acid ligase II
MDVDTTTVWTSTKATSRRTMQSTTAGRRGRRSAGSAGRRVGGSAGSAEVEHLLLEHPAVRACAVTGREDRDGLIKPVAHVVLHSGTAAGSDLGQELQHFARQRLAEYSARAGLSSSTRCR